MNVSCPRLPVGGRRLPVMRTVVTVALAAGLLPRPAAAQGSLSKAKALRAQGKTIEAEKEVTEYLKFHPNDAAAHLVLGWCQLDRENRLGAEKSFKKALKLNPNVPGAQEAKTALKLIEKSFSGPVKPPLPPKVAPSAPAPKQTPATPAATGGGIVRPASPEDYEVPKKARARRHGGRQLGGALTLDREGNLVPDQGQNKGPSLTLVISIAAAGLVLGGLIAFLFIRRGRDSDELVI